MDLTLGHAKTLVNQKTGGWQHFDLSMKISAIAVICKPACALRRGAYRAALVWGPDQKMPRPLTRQV
ncbi:MAG: hypothetical protein ACJAQW_001522 [Paracoccaceae bacterium]|jgi:hypothetical protein